MVSLKKFVNNFEELSNKNADGLEKEAIPEERIVAYNELDDNLEQYVLRKERGVPESGNTERTSFRSRMAISNNGREYFFRFSLLNPSDFINKNLVNSVDSTKDILSVDMSIFQKDHLENVTKPNKVKKLFNLHYGAYKGNVVSKDVHNRHEKKPLIFAYKSELEDFVDFNERRFYDDGNFTFHESSSNIPKFDTRNIYGDLKDENFYKGLMSEKGVNSNLIFKNLKNRDISKPNQGMYLFFDIFGKIKEKSE